ncbi:MAG: class I SAM-dependent methyltransferase [Anaerolineales bacterium]|nr:class I SAM-dependent methyltransferase [Anaerolineales bacterium]
MKRDIAEQLLRLNLQFYQTFANHFSATRQRIQPGVRKILPEIAPTHKVLDIGCGNGNLWQALVSSAFRGAYVGMDFSPELIKIAAAAAENVRSGDLSIPKPIFFAADLSGADWRSETPDERFDWVFLLAVLHHLPGIALRQKILSQIASLMNPDGRLVVSVWQFRKSAKLSQRIQDWSMINLDQNDLNAGDYLLDWRSGGRGLRYVHEFSEAELHFLAEMNGFSIRSSYCSDGDGGNLSQYQVWELAK